LQTQGIHRCSQAGRKLLIALWRLAQRCSKFLSKFSPSASKSLLFLFKMPETELRRYFRGLATAMTGLGH